MFEIVTAENSLHLTVNDNAGVAPTEAMITGNSSASIAWALTGYAKRHNLNRERVGYAVRPVKVGEV